MSRSNLQPRTHSDHARQAAMDAPTARQIKAYHDAMLPYDATPLRTGQYRGWSWRLWPSHITPGRFYVTADRVAADGTPELRQDECETEDAARAWMRTVL